MAILEENKIIARFGFNGEGMPNQSGGAAGVGGGGVGDELILNGNFATDTIWTKGLGWTISGGYAHTDGQKSNLTQPVAITAAKTYRLVILNKDQISASIGVGVRVGSLTSTQSFSGEGWKIAQIVAGADNLNFAFAIDLSTNFVGTIGRVSLREIL
jgi:hypothetical protein